MYNILDINYESVNDIKILWEKNRIYHEKNSLHFEELYRSITFEDVLESLKHINQKDLKISVALRDDSCIGYCISLVHIGSGELKSLHVDQSYRKLGIGKELVNRHITWMKEKECKSINVKVSHENEPTISFYKDLGFYPNTLDMQLK